jgi:hypothetical protein
MTENLKPDNPAAQSHEDRQHALDRKRYAVEKWTLFFLFLYVTIAGFQWCANKQAADAAKNAADTASKQLEITSSANLIPDIQYDSGRVRINLRNNGKFIASHIQGKLTIAWRSIPTNSIFGKERIVDFFFPNIEGLPANNPGSTGQPQQVSVPLDEIEMKPFLDGENAMVTDISYSYYNGFNTIPDRKCEGWIGFPEIKSRTETTGGQPSPVSCQELATVMVERQRAYQATKERFQKQNATH